jgi:sporulation protein YlmC with PRC-barrel domain
MEQVLTFQRGFDMTRVVPKFATAAAVAALLALGTGAASAQSAMPSGAAPPAHTAAPTSNAPSTSSAPMKDPLTSEDTSQIAGSSVVASDGTSIGKVSTVLMDPSSKKIDRLVVAEGGVLGVGAHKVALPVDSFHWDSQKRSFTIQKTADDLKAMPEWQQPQLAEAPAGSSSTTSAPPSSHDSGTSAGANGSSPAGAASVPIAPSGNAR